MEDEDCFNIARLLTKSSAALLQDVTCDVTVTVAAALGSWHMYCLNMHMTIGEQCYVENNSNGSVFSFCARYESAFRYHIISS